MGVRTALVAIVTATLAACAKESSSPAYTPNTGPTVSLACLEAARNGTLITDSPVKVGRYRVAHFGEGTLYVSRDGRKLSVNEGKALRDGFRATGTSSQASALDAVQSCPDVSRASCLTLRLWLCQTSLERLTEELDAALTTARADDGELGVKVEVLESEGPRCKLETSCEPDRHYSAHPTLARYEPSAPRRPIGGGAGHCESDADCEGQENQCLAWYLRGNTTLVSYVAHAEPTFCGCVERACTWFDQPSAPRR